MKELEDSSIELQQKEQIYQWLKNAKSIVITAGAGMGVDSGLADYRGTGGQWGNIEAQENTSVFDIVNPESFNKNPALGWRMYASRLIEYTNIKPHNGFGILMKWIHEFNLDYFVLTSNVDNQFQKAGFDENKIREMHGSIFYLQCTEPCTEHVWEHTVELKTVLSEIESGVFPVCPNCENLARPNVYMFRDNTYISNRSNEQKAVFQQFLSNANSAEMVVFEIGSGPHVQSIRQKTRMLGIEYNAKIVRINPKDSKIKAPHIGIGKGALEALVEIDEYIENKKQHQ